MRFAFLGAGELVQEFCKTLTATEPRPAEISVWARSLNDPHRGKPAFELARLPRVQVSSDLREVVTGADWVFSAVSGSQLLNVAKQVAALGPHRAWYVDLNSGDPESIVQSAQLLHPLGWHYIDGGVMGPAPHGGHATPTVISGPQANRAKELLEEFGFDLRIVGNQPGQASTLKLLRNLIGKNFAAVVIEALLASELLGVRNVMEEYVLEILTAKDPQRRIERWVTGTVVHGERRRKEQDASASLVERAGGTTFLTRGTCQLIDYLLLVTAGTAVREKASTSADVIRNIARLIQSDQPSLTDPPDDGSPVHPS